MEIKKKVMEEIKECQWHVGEQYKLEHFMCSQCVIFTMSLISLPPSPKASVELSDKANLVAKLSQADVDICCSRSMTRYQSSTACRLHENLI